MSQYIDSVRSAVAGWFDSHKDKGFTDAWEVFGSSNQEDIKTLIAEYNTEYDPNVES